MCPGVPDPTRPAPSNSPSGTPESFMDTPLVNGTPYPTLSVNPTAYRFHILNGANDRTWNLGLYVADPLSFSITAGGAGYAPPPALPPAVTITGCSAITSATANVDLNGAVTGITVVYPATGPACVPPVTVSIPAPAAAVPPAVAAQAFAVASLNTEVKMVPAVPAAARASLPNCPTASEPTMWGGGLVTAIIDAAGLPLNNTGLPANCWPLYNSLAGYTAGPLGEGGLVSWGNSDGRLGGVPDPTTAGPPIIQIGSEGGLLPQLAVIPSTPVSYDYNKRSITVLNILNHGLLLGGAERADFIVDFSKFAGKTLILYNDAPAPVPAGDPRLDYFTNGPDFSTTGGAPTTMAGYGPNVRTIMQIVVGATGATAPLNVQALANAMPGIFASTQDPVIVPETSYGAPTNTYSRIQDTSLNFTSPTPATGVCPTIPCAVPMLPKAIQELFTLDYGRMNATLGVELPFTNFLTQTTIPYGYADPPTEIFKNGETQIWKITHNGVDTHFMHFHLFTVQVINRVGWDGAVKPPDPNEMSFKDTVRMNPLEDIIVALKPMTQSPFPFKVPNSYRPLLVTQPIGYTSAIDFTNVDPANQPVNVINDTVNFGWEYVWHCHILGHEENDMMRGMILAVAPDVPGLSLALTGASGGTATANLAWSETSSNYTGFSIQKSLDPTFLTGVSTFTVAATPLTWTDPTPVSTTVPTFYRIMASNLVGYTRVAGYPNVSADSIYSAPVSTLGVVPVAPTVTFTGAPATAPYLGTFVVLATTNAFVMPTISGTAGVCSVGPVTGTATSVIATVTMNAATGACLLTASWPATPSYLAATAAQTTNAVPATPTVTFTGAPASAPYLSTFVVTATTNATSVPTIAGTAGVCSVGAVTGTAASAVATVTMNSGTGTCTLTANWAADASFIAATATQSTLASAIAPTVTFTGAPASAPYLGTFVVTATTNATSIPAIAGTAGVCSVGAVTGTAASAVATVTMNSGAGTCVLTANWAADANYSAATASQSTLATPAVPVVTFTGAPATATYGTTFVVTATYAGVPVQVPGITPSGACAIGGVTGNPAIANIAMTSGTGTCTVSAAWPATVNYAAATLTQTTTAAKAIPIVSFSGAPASAAYGSQFVVTATTTATDATVLPVVTPAGACSVGTVSGIPDVASSTVTMTAGAGTCTLSASWPATLNFAAASATQAATTAAKGPSTMTLTPTPNPSVPGQPVTMAFSVAKLGPIAATGTVSVTASNGQSCTGTLTNGAGSCVITFGFSGSRTLTATYAGDATYLAGTTTGITQNIQDFTISVTPTTATAAGGQRRIYTVTVRSGYTFAGTVTVTGTAGLPAGYVISAPIALVVKSGGSATGFIAVTTVAGFPATYRLTFTGVYGTGAPATGGLTHAVNANLVVTN